ncbi:MAG: nitrilase [Saprospiraceae bacterium]|nr:nitrilase [Saprospiraceae bacterium]
MRELNIAVAQFAPHDGDKVKNLSILESLVVEAKKRGAEVVSFHEMCITAYTFTQDLSRADLAELAEHVPSGPSIERLRYLAGQYDLCILAGLIEKDGDRFYNTYVCVDKEGVKAKFRKLHPFISKHLSPGNEYVVFNLNGWKCGILICYDNNVIENVRATTLLGAELIFAPHVTGCTPSAMPGRGFVDDALWKNRASNPAALHREFNGPKGRGWLMRWLPARAYDNGVYYAFSNPIGYDGDHLKNGNAMILDPYGEVVAEASTLGNEVVVAKITEDKLKLAGGFRYRNARRPELYGSILSAKHDPELKPIWMKK